MARFRKLPPSLKRPGKPDRGAAWFIITQRRRRMNGSIETNVIITEAGVAITTEDGQTLIIE